MISAITPFQKFSVMLKLCYAHIMLISAPITFQLPTKSCIKNVLFPLKKITQNLIPAPSIPTIPHPQTVEPFKLAQTCTMSVKSLYLFTLIIGFSNFDPDKHNSISRVFSTRYAKKKNSVAIAHKMSEFYC